ncbi:MAG: TonB-dependent receptor domain-containing protein [Prolixibacteraceae bacterium]
MKIIFLVCFLLILHLAFSAENSIKGIVRENDNHDQPVVGANIYWAKTTLGTTSDSNGNFELNKHMPSWPLVISFVGFLPDTIQITPDTKTVEILLRKQLELDEVVVKERLKGQYISTMDPIQSSKITSTELQKAACCNLSESFETNASVDVSYSDAVTGAKQIQMLGLSGIYVQTISENMPTNRSMAAPYGLGYVPGPWMEAIQISKGTSSVSNGYEAITGQINVEYKKPQDQEILHVNLYGNEVFKSEANLNYAYKFNDNLSTMILLHGENHSKEIDDNGDSFLDMPHIQQINFMNRWNYIPKKGGHREIGVKLLDEHRQSGQVGAFDENLSNLYGIDIRTRHYEVFAKNGIIFNKPGTSLGIQASASYHNQESSYGNKTYQGTQTNTYLNVIYMGNFGSDLHSYKTGVSYMGDGYNEELNSTKHTHTEAVPGAFFQYAYNLNNKLNILAGIRADYSTIYRLFVTPRIHTKWNANDWLTIRASAGKGYRTSIPLAENSYLLASSRELIVDQNLNQEEAINMGTSATLALPIGEKELSVSIDYYRTNFVNQVIRDVDSDVHQVHFKNLEGLSYANSFQAEAFYELVHGLTINAAYRINDVNQTINGTLRELPLVSRYKGLLSLSYATRLKKWQFDLTSQFNGGGRLPDASTVNPLWKEEFDPFTIFNAQITKNYKLWSFYVGGENLSNFTMSSPIIASDKPWGPNFDGSMIWGPVHGRTIYFGLRYTIKDYE